MKVARHLLLVVVRAGWQQAAPVGHGMIEFSDRRRYVSGTINQPRGKDQTVPDGTFSNRARAHVGEGYATRGRLEDDDEDEDENEVTWRTAGKLDPLPRAGVTLFQKFRLHYTNQSTKLPA